MTKNKDKIETDLELFRDLIHKTNDAIFVVDPQSGRFIFVNDKACNILGYDRQELLKMHVIDIEATFLDDFSWQKHVDELRQKGSHMLEGIHKRKNGATFPVEINVSYAVLKARDYMVAVVRDITERKQVAEALLIHEKQFAESQRIAHIGSWEHNLTTDQVFWSDELFRLLGLDPKTDPADFKIFLEMVHADDKPVLKKAIDETVRLHTPFNIEFRVILKNGSTRNLHAQAELIHDDTGTQAILRGTCQDITERKRAEEALKKHQKHLEQVVAERTVELARVNEQLQYDVSEMEKTKKELAKEKQMLEDIAQGITESIMLLSKDFKILWANKAALQQTGLSMEELFGNYCYKATHHREQPCEPPCDPCPAYALIKTGYPGVEEHTHYDKNDNKLFVEVSAYPIRNASGEIVNFVHISKDITERRRLEEEKEKLVRDLQEALANVKKLSGMLPICASCKKIRDDTGYWQQIEAYISEHSEALFTHAICPECVKKLYPEYYENIWGKKEKKDT